MGRACPGPSINARDLGGQAGPGPVYKSGQAGPGYRAGLPTLFGKASLGPWPSASRAWESYQHHAGLQYCGGTQIFWASPPPQIPYSCRQGLGSPTPHFCLPSPQFNWLVQRDKRLIPIGQDSRPNHSFLFANLSPLFAMPLISIGQISCLKL